MTITNGYCTLAQFKQRAGITSTDAARDADLELIIQAASRKIDQFCGRVFYASSSAGESRYYTAQNRERVYIDDHTSITALETDDDGDGTIETTWTTSDYWEMPLTSFQGTDWPYMWLQIKPEGSYSFPAGLPNGVKITGIFGWSSVPDEVREACLMIANRQWQRRAAPFGVLGANEFGAPTIITRVDPDILGLLEPYRRIV